MNSNHQNIKNEISLHGRSYLNSYDLSPNEILFLLSAAADFKKKDLSKHSQFAGKSITYFGATCPDTQTSLFNAARKLQMHFNQLTIDQSISSNYENMQDFGRLLSSETDMIFCRIRKHSLVQSLAKKSLVPVINTGSFRCILLRILSDVFTLQEHFSKIDGLTVVWVGNSCPVLNTYLTIVPRLGINFKFVCKCGGPVSPSELMYAMTKHPNAENRIKECFTLEEALKNADVVISASHSEKSLQLNLNYLNMFCNKGWVYMHILPRTRLEVDDTIFESPRNILWKSYSNLKWICRAIITNFLHLNKNCIPIK